jgi:hypothetical protein
MAGINSSLQATFGAAMLLVPLTISRRPDNISNSNGAVSNIITLNCTPLMTEDTKPHEELTDSISDPHVPDVAAFNPSTRHYIRLHTTDGDRRHVRVEKYFFERYSLSLSLSLCDKMEDNITVIISTCTPLTTRFSLSVLV